MKGPLKIVSIFSLTVLLGLLSIELFTASKNEAANELEHESKFNEDYRVYAIPTPKNVDFAGEAVPLNLIDVKEKLDRELLVNTYWQSQTMLFVKRSNRWFPVIEKILEEQGVPDDLKYIALIESGLDQVVSPAGATGFWQLMKTAARENGLEISSGIDERYNIEKSTVAACQYLKQAHAKFGSWTLAAASYNMGMAGLQKQLDRQQATNYYDLVLNDETSRYLFRIMAAKTILKDPSKFGFTYREEDLYNTLRYSEIQVNHTVPDLAEFAFENGINYKALKYLNPWLRDNYLPNDSHKNYSIKIPTKPLSEVLVNDKAQVATFTREKSDEREQKGAAE
ncbi:lytic transglycosylase domain-containing protein [bacterium]|nr:lytic transglycosylase domain-containing protein [bacterium]MDC1222022.1 lytic transglycosylase domain-containing protein [Salibacteraceae bacterium]